MAATETLPDDTRRGGVGGVPSPGIVAVSPPSNRRRPLMVLGALLVVVSALVAAWLVASVSETNRVLVADAALSPGTPISEGDLRVVEVGGGLNLSSIRADRQASIIGKYPSSPIPAGTLLQPSMFVDPDEVIPEGKVIVSAMLDPGQIPAGAKIGDQVAMINTAIVDAKTGPKLIGRAEVFDLAEQDGSYRVSLLINNKLQLPFAAASSSDNLLLGVVG